MIPKSAPEMPTVSPLVLLVLTFGMTLILFGMTAILIGGSVSFFVALLVSLVEGDLVEVSLE